MADIMELRDRSFLAEVNLRAGVGAYRMVKDFLNRAGIPNPQGPYEDKNDPTRPSEFFEGPRVVRAYFNGLSLSVVHNEIGLKSWLRSKITRNKAALKSPAFSACEIKDPRILSPLLQVRLGKDAYLEIVPGIERVQIDSNGLSDISEELKARKIRFIEPSTEFVGRIAKGGDEAVLITNRRMVEALPSHNFASGTECPLQEQIFGELRAAFQDAHECGESGALRKVFAQCRDNARLPSGHEDKILHPYWEQHKHASRRIALIALAAQNFEQRLDVA